MAGGLRDGRCGQRGLDGVRFSLLKGCRYMFCHTNRTRLLLVVLGAAMISTAALAQSCEVRTFLSRPSLGLTTDLSFQYLQSCVKGRFVCPYCSFSRNVPGTCPNPWGINLHPANVALADVADYVCPACGYASSQSGVCPDPWNTAGHAANVTLQPRTGALGRLLSLAFPVMPNGKFDLLLPDSAGALVRRAILGRPFHPTDGGVQGAAVYAAVAGLVNNTASQGPIISAGMHGRFLIIPPTALKREPRPADTGTVDYTVPTRKVMAQADPGATNGGTTANMGGNDLYRPIVRGKSAGAAVLDPNTDLGANSPYLNIGVNPYRVDDGDYWTIRYTETATYDNANQETHVTQASIDIYSTVYGYDGEVDASNMPLPLVISNGGNDLNYPFDVVSDSGAVRLTIGGGATGGGWSDSNGTHTWIIGFMTRSTCRLFPGWREMKDTVKDPYYYNLDSGALEGDPTSLNTAFNFPGKKKCSFAIGANPVNFTSESNIEPTPPAALPGSPPAAPYRLPIDAVGEGTVAAEWAGDAAGGWGDSTTGPMPVYAHYRRTGGEWQYDGTFYPALPPRTVTNNSAVAQTPKYDTAAKGYHVNLLASRFMASRVAIPATMNTWKPDPSSAAVSVESGTPNVDFALYPRQVIGWLNGGEVTGSFAAGTNTPSRNLALTNRWDGSNAVTVCQTCGAFWPKTLATLCPYHLPTPPPPVPPPNPITVSGAKTVAYNGTYTLQAGLQNNQPWWAMAGGYDLYFTGTDWCISVGMTGVGYHDGNGTLPGKTGWKKGSGPNPKNPGPTLSYVVPAPVPTSSLVELAGVGGGSYQASRDTWRQAVSVGTDQRMAAGGTVRNVMRPEAFRSSGMTVGHAATAGTPEQLSASIPAYQPPSVPGGGLVNDQANDLGYRGGQVVYHNLTAPNMNSGLTSKWNAFYKNPDCGYFQPGIGLWPLKCPVGGEVYWYKTWVVANMPYCPIHTTTRLDEVAGRHYVCPVCGAEYALWPGTGCPFDGYTGASVQVPPTDVVRDEHLVAEEYDPFDVQVSVSRKGEIAQTTPNVAIGRTEPGVPTRRPDTTVGPLVSHRAFPGDVSSLPAHSDNPTDARISLRNEGNVALSPRVSNTYDFDINTVADRGLDHYLRIDLSPNSLSYGRKAQSGPLTRDTFMPLQTISGSAGLFEAGLSAQAAWDAYTQTPGAASGAATSGFVTAGSYVGRLTPKPVPLGQPVGTYTGAHLQYVDIDGNGALDFWSLAGGGETSTATTQFNPAVDLPREPLVGVIHGQTRVFETRLPQNDYYSLDSDPIVLPSPSPGVMQVIWATNRLSTSTGATAPGAAGTTPADLPQSNAAVNLVYITTAGLQGGAQDELYRMYGWPTTGGVLDDPGVMTNSPAGTINGIPWIMYNQDQSTKFAFWHRSLRHAGGVESTLRYNSTQNWAWNPANEKFLYDTGLPKQGLRGFWQPSGAWLFWHSGQAGRERLMYRWNFTGTVTDDEAPVPVTNQAPAGQMLVRDQTVEGQTDLINATLPTTLPDGTTVAPNTLGIIQRPSVSPFTYTKDASVFVNSGEVNLFFSGFVTHEGNADICWTRYGLSSMAPAAAADNFAKKPFPSITNYEEMQADGLHQRYASRHLDWMVDRNFATSGPAAGTVNPQMMLQFAYHDTIGDGLPRPSQSFGIDWNGGTYDRARGIYRVTPVLYGWSGATFPAGSPFVIPQGTGWYIRDPNSSDLNKQPLTMEINIAAGTVQFTSPLFNEDTPGDRSAAFSNALIFNGAALEDVVMRINYTPYIYRVTRTQAQDDCPSAFYDPTVAQRLTVFWRRSYPTSEAPHFGRAAFMYKVYTTSVQVGRPPAAAAPTFTDAISAAAMTPNASNDSAGIYNFNASDIGRFVNIVYDGVGGTFTERHQVIGWSREMAVPVDTVLGEGSLVAVPESFGVPRTEGDGNNLIPAVRYWLFWSSPRGVYDLRLVENNGTRKAPGVGQPYDLAVHPSSDIYTAVVAPEFGSLAPERTVLTVTPDGT